VLLLLGDEEWHANGLNWIARKCGVSWDTANRVEAEWLSSRIEKIERPAKRKVQRGGKVYEMETAAIGRSNGNGAAPAFHNCGNCPPPGLDAASFCCYNCLLE
jgi:hypothetical protein